MMPASLAKAVPIIRLESASRERFIDVATPDRE
jgi:hypothetical protein